MKKRKLQLSKLWTGSIVAAFIVAVAIFLGMLQIEKNVLTQYVKGKIYVAAERIPKGQLLTPENCMQYFVQKEVDAACIPQTALQNPEQIKDMMPVFDIDEGVLLTTGMFIEKNEITAEMKNPVIAGVKAEDLYQVAGGILRAGDRIHIYTVSESGETMPVWNDAFIQQVFDQTGNRILSDDTVTAAHRMNIYLDKEDVERFYAALAAGSLRIVEACD